MGNASACGGPAHLLRHLADYGEPILLDRQQDVEGVARTRCATANRSLFVVTESSAQVVLQLIRAWHGSRQQKRRAAEHQRICHVVETLGEAGAFHHSYRNVYRQLHK